jgi:hypothetical protein
MTDQPTVAVPAGVILLTDEQAGPLLRTAETIAAVGAWAVDHRQDVLPGNGAPDELAGRAVRLRLPACP